MLLCFIPLRNIWWFAKPSWSYDSRFKQLGDMPTRLGEILDYCLVIINKSSQPIQCEVIESGFSDHIAVFLKLSRESTKYENRLVLNWSMFKELIHCAKFNWGTWCQFDTADSLVGKTTDRLRFHKKCNQEWKQRSATYTKGMVFNKLRPHKGRWKEESDPVTK